jgi:hypothetical protein
MICPAIAPRICSPVCRVIGGIKPVAGNHPTYPAAHVASPRAAPSPSRLCTCGREAAYKAPNVAPYPRANDCAAAFSISGGILLRRASPAATPTASLCHTLLWVISFLRAPASHPLLCREAPHTLLACDTVGQSLPTAPQDAASGVLFSCYSHIVQPLYQKVPSATPLRMKQEHTVHAREKPFSRRDF